MTDKRIVLTTTSSKDEAHKIARVIYYSDNFASDCRIRIDDVAPVHPKVTLTNALCATS